MICKADESHVLIWTNRGALNFWSLRRPNRRWYCQMLGPVVPRTRRKVKECWIGYQVDVFAVPSSLDAQFDSERDEER